MAAKLQDDGYDRDGFIAAASPEPNGERLHDAVTFKYRVATRRDLIKHEAAIKVALANESIDPEAKLKAEEIACKFVVDRVPQWDVTTAKGQPAPVNVDSLLRVHPMVFGAMYNIVRGWRTSDPLPNGEVKAEPTDEESQKN